MNRPRKPRGPGAPAGHQSGSSAANKPTERQRARPASKHPPSQETSASISEAGQAGPRRRRRKRKPRANLPSPERSKTPVSETVRCVADSAASEDSVDLDVFKPDEIGIGSRVMPVGPDYPEFNEGREELTNESAHFPAPDSAYPADVQEQIRDLEARLDGMIRRTKRDDEEEPPSIREQVGSRAREVVERLTSPLPLDASESVETDVLEAARELLSSKYYVRQWGRAGMRSRAEEVDDFGLDPNYEQRLYPLFDFLFNRYFRIETFGIENIPNQGRAIVVANHSGTLPLDGPMLRSAFRLGHPGGRELRWLAEDYVFYLPFVGAFMNRIGAVRACQENAERLLRKEALVAVFPEGLQGIRKLYKHRYRLQRFGRGGFVRLCLRTGAPLIPCAVIGAEEASPMLYRIEYLASALGLPYIPITPTFPALGPLGLVPAPSKWRIYFGEPMHFDGYGRGAADDHVLVGRLSEQVRGAIQRLLDRGLEQRKNVWFG